MATPESLRRWLESCPEKRVGLCRLVAKWQDEKGKGDYNRMCQALAEECRGHTPECAGVIAEEKFSCGYFCPVAPCFRVKAGDWDGILRLGLVYESAEEWRICPPSAIARTER